MRIWITIQTAVSSVRQQKSILCNECRNCYSAGGEKMEKQIGYVGFFDSGTGKTSKQYSLPFQKVNSGYYNDNRWWNATDKGFKKMRKPIKVIGKIGNTEYQNNDRCKVTSRFFSSKTIYTCCSHGDCPMVVRRWQRR